MIRLASTYHEPRRPVIRIVRHGGASAGAGIELVLSRRSKSKVQSVDQRMRLGMRCRLSPTAVRGSGTTSRRVRSYGLSRIRRAAACQLDAASVMDFRPAKDRNLLRDLKPLRPLRENVLGPLASVRSANATI